MVERCFESREEWVLMYRNGLTQAQIAVLCNMPREFINRSIGAHKRGDPSLEVDHVANRPEPSQSTTPPLPSPQWLAYCDELVRFLSEHGRPPRLNISDVAELSLARWVGRQRTAARNGSLDPSWRRALDRAGNWQESARTQRDDARWRARLDLLSEFKSNEGRWPSYRHYANESERILGTWLHQQRQGAFNVSLLPEKRKLLDAAVPGWNTWRQRPEK
jgi:hypothetical protein